MTQLWMWEYNGQDEVGIKSVVDKQELFRTDDFYSLATQHSRRTIGQVTNLHKVKAVDEADIVFDDAAIGEILYFLNLAWVGVLPSCNLDNKRLGKLLNLFREPPKPVTEPKRFGAIVEAQLDGRHGIGGFPVAERKHLWKLEGSGWELINIEGFSALWCWFIDPVVISEGVRN